MSRVLKFKRRSPVQISVFIFCEAGPRKPTPDEEKKIQDVLKKAIELIEREFGNDKDDEAET